ncbi:hypothetical protein EMIHUDRAFT_221086 [Emiliania huxleyi CCMP1516]|uniref:Phytanoyl-CoA dioxygenase n=2 Tax=Emiliania huxleyi TaxID=2903 RepID=A0A0D3HZZ0_EMIH1|nr:hypothetical protein EMIHUDRAFT_221086 [Emiliania huxleyi CCMP1516]EOD04575.1 hypothetical protein EMIHUDRAFT_221086 [Emiliania huxleyi CCMP1516]|eukprot:XP_005757004.1 hypothetical protein EMIHUDRAFT_221086 [Emiliania huxleyi CCMP1516]
MSHFPADWVDPSTGLPHQAGTKILEAHSHSKALSNLLRHPKLFRMVELVLDDVGVATQSLLFSHGSKQALHRDPWFVPTNPASTMLASWVAMEDISPNSGPLAFIPGSHRLPWKLLDGTGDILFADPYLLERRTASTGLDPDSTKLAVEVDSVGAMVLQPSSPCANQPI